MRIDEIVNDPEYEGKMLARRFKLDGSPTEGGYVAQQWKKYKNSGNDPNIKDETITTLQSLLDQGLGNSNRTRILIKQIEQW